MASENLLFLVYKPKNYTYDVSWRKEFNLFMCIVNTFKKTCGLCCFLCAAANRYWWFSFILMARRQSLGHLGKHAKITASLPVEFSGFLEEELHPKLLILTLYICCAGT